jgi:F0F1-type ATP synthase assembly protein I
MLRWQAGATLGVALVAGLWVGIDGAISAALGGMITVLAGIAFAVVVSIKNSPSAEATLVTMFLAEGAKIAAIILLLWVVITAYKDLVAGGVCLRRRPRRPTSSPACTRKPMRRWPLRNFSGGWMNRARCRRK